ncbi:MAG: LysR family transcriptional regulator [Flavobacteriia bacterium]|nr:LysR family transcriptional regulator [Flavobacteriia bacterium]
MELSFQQISYIIALAEEKSFGKASKQCFVTQPTLSMQIKKAEETLGFALFDRESNPIELSDDGKQILPYLYDLKADLEEVKRYANRKNGVSKNEIKIGIIPTIAAYLVPALFSNKAKFKHLIKWELIELKSEDLLVALQQKKIDMGIMAGPYYSEDLDITPLYNEEIMLYYPETNKDNLHVSELEVLQPWLLTAGNCLRTQMINFCQLSEEKQSEWNYEGGNLEMLIKMVNMFGGYTLIPYFYKESYLLQNKGLKHLYSEKTTINPARTILSLSSPKNRKRAEMNELINFLKSQFANLKEKEFNLLNWK